MKILEDKLETISGDAEIKSKVNNQEIKLKTISATLSKLENISKSKEGKLECSECDYITSSEKLLKNHLKITHKDQKNSEFPRECDLCGV